jgi:hypothetical protein
VKFLKSYAEYLIIEKPTTVDNLSMVEYQFGYMYWRYLMWNFVGRQMTTKGVMELRMETGLVALNLLMNSRRISRQFTCRYFEQ